MNRKRQQCLKFLNFPTYLHDSLDPPIISEEDSFHIFEVYESTPGYFAGVKKLSSIRYETFETPGEVNNKIPLKIQKYHKNDATWSFKEYHSSSLLGIIHDTTRSFEGIRIQ